ncbi:hypothetical protein SSX86_009310 [Deinandra increscens subsp. villosa]|uniref:Uncharacterized protein n=1 Tax=Deinandra increscens subsp. villosa TaxID=3103831 RepID=A0AAP0DGY1_9ASTR
MVLWEIALTTAYFLGLKKTYRHVLRLQRRLVSPNSPKIRQFLHSKTRTVFDATLKVHREVQKRDIKIGRNFGNWILRWLEKIEPSPAVQIHAGGPIQRASNTIRTPNKLLTDSRRRITAQGLWYRESRRRLVTSSRNLLLTAYPTVSNLLRRRVPVMNGNMQYRQLVSGSSGFENGVIRGDILQWLSRG